ncbi:MAG: HEAT repeat domain-containing protein [Pyrinomonadaceae bacterium]
MSFVEIEQLIAKFRTAAKDKGDFATPAKRDHRFYDEMRTAALAIGKFDSPGKEAFKALLKDESVHVRSWAAATLLVEGDVEARIVLEQIAKSEGIIGLNAEMALREFDRGNLKPPFWKEGK